MTDALTAVLLIAGMILVFSVAVRLLPYPLRRLRLDQRKLSAVFGGLIRFGRDSAYVEVDQKSTGDHILFTKRYRENDNWILEVTISSPRASADFLNGVKSDLIALEDRFKIEDDTCESCDLVRFFLTGRGLKDYVALEGVARLLVRHLGHPKNTKYRIEFKGPYDHKATDKYYSDLMEQWRKQ